VNPSTPKPDVSVYRVEHVAIWTANLERQKAFYETYFHAEAGPKYINPKKAFASYFLRFGQGARIELMQTDDLAEDGEHRRRVGYAHLALAVGSEERVNELTALLRRDGYVVVDGPRWTGDGYYESVVLDPDGNRIEITV
jgi:lactoylglutathione lyase